jgi:cell division topological specificity factor MinE
MLDFVRWVIRRREQTKDIARERLHLALMRDRFDLAPDVMAALKRDVIDAVSRYMVVVEDDVKEFEIRREEESVFLVSNIRVKDMHRWASVQ